MSERKKVLIVDDDPDFVEGIKAILDTEYDTEVTYNPKDGWEALKRGSHDLLCLDIMMGRGAEGVMMARKIRKDPVLREMPVLIITSLPRADRVPLPRPGSAPRVRAGGRAGGKARGPRPAAAEGRDHDRRCRGAARR